ncbi:MAG: metabolite traffic protein EboE [Puia sp.]|nr:metabolite traffic protein EboE [Puia sp.]
MLTSAGHLTYCTNIHSGENWGDHFKALQTCFPAIRKALSPSAPMGIGLRLSNEASLELADPETLRLFREWLKQQDAYVFTMNGFPYGGFHHTRVKDQVHAPDWTTRERVEYTLRMFGILEQILPENMDGGISTSPLSYRYWHSSMASLAAARQKATRHMIEVVEHLAKIRLRTGRLLHLDVEPEPDGLLETGPEFIDWFENDLLPIGIPVIGASLGLSEEQAAEIIKDHLRLCYDVCHFAIGYEPHATVVAALQEKGLKIGKIQISAALKASMGSDPSKREALKEAFAKYNEPVYLHQVVAKKADGGLLRYRDLAEALDDYQHPLTREWRAHFHVPVFEKDFGLLQSTRDDIREVLEIQQELDLTRHLEVETYTWEVLDPSLKLPLQESIIRELDWVKRQLD